MRRVTHWVTRQLDWRAVDLEEKIVTIGADIAKKRRLRVIDSVDSYMHALIVKLWSPIVPNPITIKRFNMDVV